MTEPVQVALTLTVANENEANDAVCELNIDGNDVILQAVGDQNALDLILQRAQQDQVQRSCTCKVILYLFATVCLSCTLSELGITICMSLRRPDILLAEHHPWEFEGPLLVAQALLTLMLSSFVLQVVIRANRVSTRVYFSCLAGLAFVISMISGWIFREDSHRHDLKNMSSAKARLKVELMTHFSGHPEHTLPMWLVNLQQSLKCCGVDSIDDWRMLWSKPDVPDSCCVKTYTDCGKRFFSSRAENSTENGYYTMGCINSAESFSSKYMFLLEQIKFAEAFLIIFITLIWLCCWDKFLSRPDQELLVRYTSPPQNETMSVSAAPEPRQHGTRNETEPSRILSHRPAQAVESRHSQRGGGDLGTKSDYMLTPKGQDNYQSGDYTEVDPTKARHASSAQQLNFTAS